MDQIEHGTRGRVLTVTSNFPRWAGDSTTPFVLHLAADLQKLGWDVDVLAPHDAGAAASESLSGVSVRRFRYMWPESAETLCYRGGALLNLRESKSNLIKTPMFVLSELAATMSQLRSGYDLIHSHWLLPQGFVGSVASRLTSVPHVTTIHGGDVFALNSSLLRTFKRLAINGAHAVTVNSSATRTALKDLGGDPGEVRTIPMGVTTDLASDEAVRSAGTKFPTSGLRIVFVGRLVDEKGVGDLIEALDLVDTELDIGALIVGEGPARHRFEHEVQIRGIGGSVRFAGWVQPEEVPAILRAADVYVGPSRRAPDGWQEAYGLSFAEALSAGTPVIATRSGGIGDIVEDGVNGVVVDERSPQQIAEAIEVLARSADQRLSYGRAGRSKAIAHLSREASAHAFSDLFESLI